MSERVPTLARWLISLAALVVPGHRRVLVATPVDRGDRAPMPSGTTLGRDAAVRGGIGIARALHEKAGDDDEGLLGRTFDTRPGR